MKKIGWAIATALSLPFLGLGASEALANDSFGAIAFSDITRSHGYSYNYATQAAAEARALRECESVSGTGDCRVLVWFRNACAAMARGTNGAVGTGWGANQALANRYAVQSCNGYGGTSCQIIRQVCTPQ